MFEFGGSLFSSLCGILDVKSSFTRPISRVFLTFDLQQCKMIYSFVDISLHLSSFESGLCKFIFRQMFKHSSLVNNGK